MDTLKKVHLNLVGIDGNAFNIMGAFRRQAKIENWTKEEIDEVIDEAMSGDYNHLLYTISERCDMTDDSDDEDEMDDDYDYGYDDYDDDDDDE